MKSFILITAIVLGGLLFAGGCYTVLDLPERDYVENYEQPEIIIINNPPPCIDCYPPPPPPKRSPDPIIVPYIPPEKQYERPRDLADLRNNDGNGKNPVTDRQRR